MVVIMPYKHKVGDRVVHKYAHTDEYLGGYICECGRPREPHTITDIVDEYGPNSIILRLNDVADCRAVASNMIVLPEQSEEGWEKRFLTKESV